MFRRVFGDLATFLLTILPAVDQALLSNAGSWKI